MIDGRPVYSASVLDGQLACENLTAIERARLVGLVATPHYKDRELEVLQKRGFQHEQRYLNALRAEFRTVFEVKPDHSLTDSGARLRQEAEATRAAMVAGKD